MIQIPGWQRSLKAKYYAGMWDATGGSVKAGESPEEAAVREVKEELASASKACNILWCQHR